MNILRQAKRLEAGITRVFDSAIRSRQNAPLEPLELIHAVVSRISAETLPSGRGKQTFPFNQIRVFVSTPTKEARARFAAVAESEPSLPARVQERLRAAGCEVSDLVIKTIYTPAPAAHWSHAQWHVEFARVLPSPTPLSQPDAAPVAQAVEPPVMVATLRATKGRTVNETMMFTQSRVDVGRCAEVQDHRQRLLRTNHVVFADDEDSVNQSVSRCHAHLLRMDDGYRLFDDRSAHGTSIIRDGKTVGVPPGSRGVKVRSGDVICLGEARLAVQIDGATAR